MNTRGSRPYFPTQRKIKAEPCGPRLLFHLLVRSETRYLSQLELGEDTSWWVNLFRHFEQGKMKDAVRYAARFKRHPTLIIGADQYERWCKGDKSAGKGVHEAIRRHLQL